MRLAASEAEVAAGSVVVDLVGGARFERGELMVDEALVVGGGHMLVAAGGVRASIEGDDIRVADDRFATAIEGFARCDDGWLFLASDGVVAYADDFVGALTPVATLPTAEWRMRTNGGAGRFVSDDGRAFLGPCRGPLQPVAPAGDAPVVGFEHVAGVTAAVIEGGRLYRSPDGSSGWTAVDSMNGVAIGLHANADSIFVATTDGCLAFTGSAEPRRESACPPWEPADSRHTGRMVGLEHDTLSTERARALLERMIAAHPVLLEAVVIQSNLSGADQAPVHPLRTSDGRFIAERRGALSFFGRNGSIVDYPHPQGGERCMLTAWGPHAAVLCDDMLYRVGASDSVEQVVLPEGRHGVVLSDDGRHLVYSGGCAGTERPLDPNAGDPRAVLCLHDSRDDRGTSLFAETSFSRVVVRGASILAFTDAGAWFAAPGATELRSIGVVVARAVAARLPVDLAADGAVQGLVRVPDSRGREMLAAFVGDPAAELEAFPLPEGARTAGFTDRAWGIAAGGSLAELWATQDGGRHWAPIDAGVDADPARVELDGYCRESECPPALLECDRASCRVGWEARVYRDGGSRVRVLGARAPLEHPAMGEGIDTRVSALACETVSGDIADYYETGEEYDEVDAAYDEGVARPAVRDTSRDVRLSQRDAEYTLEWTHEGARHRSRMPVDELRSGIRVGEPRCVVVASLREGLLASCSLEYRSQTPALGVLWAASGGTARWIEVGGFERIEEVRWAEARGDHVLAHVGHRWRAALVRVDTRGQARVLRSWNVRSSETRFGRYWGEPAIFTVRRVPGVPGRGEYRVYGFDGGEPNGARLEGATSPVARICDAADPDATVIHGSVETVVFGEDTWPGSAALELAGSDTCVRSVNVAGLPPLEAEGGRLVGATDQVRIECTMRAR